MAESNGYFADPQRLSGEISQIAQISQMAGDMLRTFVDDVNLTRDWPGRTDSTAKELIPQEKKERTGAVDTGTALRDAVVGVANGTHVNLTNIRTTQNNNIDAIHESASGGGGSHH